MNFMLIIFMQKIKQKNAQTGRRDVVSKGPWPNSDVIEVFKSSKFVFVGNINESPKTMKYLFRSR